GPGWTVANGRLAVLCLGPRSLSSIRKQLLVQFWIVLLELAAEDRIELFPVWLPQLIRRFALLHRNGESGAAVNGYPQFFLCFHAADGGKQPPRPRVGDQGVLLVQRAHNLLKFIHRFVGKPVGYPPRVASASHALSYQPASRSFFR